MRFARSLALAAALLALPSLADAQATTTITATIVDAGNGPVTGTLCLHAVNSYDNPISISKTGGGFYLADRPFCQTLTSGALVGSLTVPNPVTDSNPGHAYDIVVYDTTSGIQTDLGAVYGIGGSSWSLDTYVPTVTIPTTAAFTFTHGSGVPSGACSAPAMYVNDGSGQIYVCVAGGWIPAAGGTGITQLSGDVTTSSGSGIQAATLATVSSTSGTCGDATHVCQVVTNPKGLTTAQSQVAISAGASLDWSAQGGTLPVQEYLNVAHPPLAYWDAALHNCTNSKVRILAPDDSRWIATSTVVPGASSTLTATFPNRLAGRLASHLAAQCGSGGTGFQALVPSWNQASLNLDFFTGASGTWTTDANIGPYQNSGSGNIGTTVLTTSAMTIPFVTTVPYDHLDVLCASGPGLHAWTLTVDSSTVGTCGGSAGSLTAVLGTSSAVTLGAHTASISCPSSPCEAYAVGGEAGTTGGVVDNLSVGSCAMECFGLVPSTQMAFIDLIPGGDQLVILSMIANEPGIGYSTSSFQSALNATISHERAETPPPSVLIYAPLQDGIGGQSTYYPILKSTAVASNTAFFDMRDRWGPSLVSWLFGPDTFHENNIGDGETEGEIAQTVIDVPPPAGLSSIPSTSCPLGYVLSGFGPAGGTCVLSGGSTVACGTGFAHHAAIAVASSSVSGGSDLGYFPALLAFNGASANSITLTNLKGTGSGGQVQSSSGLDITFCSTPTGGTQLAYELVSGTYVASTGAAEFYVDVPILSASSGATIYAFWDDASAGDLSAQHATWGNGYAAVYHGDATLADSTANANNLTNTGATFVSGAFGTAYSVSATGPTYLGDASPTGLATGTGPRTMEGWVNYASTPGGDTIPFGYGDLSGSDEMFDMDFTGAKLFTWTHSDIWTTNATMSTSAWHFIASVLPAGATAPDQVITYLDGVAVTAGATCAGGTCTNSLTTAGVNLQINGLSGSTASPATALIDEVRFSTVGRTAGWIATQYANQSNPASFWTVGTIF